jgi:hypothetical protein
MKHKASQGSVSVTCGNPSGRAFSQNNGRWGLRDTSGRYGIGENGVAVEARDVAFYEWVIVPNVTVSPAQAKDWSWTSPPVVVAATMSPPPS